MIVDIVDKVRRTYSGKAAKGDVAEIIRHHRIQASPGYRDAAAYVQAELEKAGLLAETESYPADFQTKFWTSSSFQEWEAESATLVVLEPGSEGEESPGEVLADYREQKLSLIQRSISFSGDVELVALDDGAQEGDYQDLDVAGKLVLTNADLSRVRRLAVERYGAAGILFDGMRDAPPVRETMDLPDALQYTSFWWSGAPGEQKCFGFVLSPRQGARLRKQIRQREKAGDPPLRLRAMVQADLYDGQMEVISAMIPGREKGRVLLVSHLCHPQPSANDNASGVAANLEAARALQHLVASGQLPQPRRTIQFLWMPEMTGSFAYLSRHEDEIPEMIAGINLDMVGEDQAQTGSVLVVERPPDSCPSFVPELMERIRSMIFDEVQGHTGLGGYSLTRYATTSFSGGSDHYIFSDPTVGVPMPMLNQWPDKFYHTSADTLDKVSVESMQKAGALAAASIYFMANAGERETTWLAHEIVASFQARLARQLQNMITELANEPGDRSTEEMEALLERRAAYNLARHREALNSLDRLWEGAGELAEELRPGVCQAASLELERAKKAISKLAEGDGAEADPGEADLEQWEQQGAAMTPLRLYRGPAEFMRLISTLPAEDQANLFRLMKSRGMKAYTVSTLAQYWADGKRTAAEIVDLVDLESGMRDPELIVTFFQLLEKLELVRI